MFFDFSWSDGTLMLVFTFDDVDYSRYIDTYTSVYCTQVALSERVKLWNERKFNLLHDFLTSYINTELSKDLRSNECIVKINDRGNLSRFNVNVFQHVPQVHLCQQYFDCQMLQEVTVLPPKFLCERCGILYTNGIHICQF